MSAFTFAGLAGLGAGAAFAFVTGAFDGATGLLIAFEVDALVVCEDGFAGAVAFLAGAVAAFAGVVDGLVAVEVLAGVVCAAAATARRAIVYKFFFSIFSCP